MNWNLEGERVEGMYLNQWAFSGEVVESRVKYGGFVQHTVIVDTPFKAYGEVRSRICVDHNEITYVESKEEAHS